MIESLKKSESFEEKWQSPEKVILLDQEVEVYDIRPEVEKTNVPVFLAPGWGGTPAMHKQNVETLFKEGRRTLLLNTPHGINFSREDFSSQEIGEITDAELREIAALINCIKEKNIEKVDVVAHSQGCIDTVLTAMLYPEYFRNIVLVNPAGMIGEDNFARLVVSFSADIVKGYIEEIRRNGIQKPLLSNTRVVATTETIIKNPLLALREVLAISDAQIHEFLIELKKQGIGISVVGAVDDEVFPSNRMQKIVTKDMVDGFCVTRGAHAQFNLEPDAYTGLAESALTSMENISR